MGRVLITGVAGFIGSNLAARLLPLDYEVVGIDDLSSGTLENIPPGVHFCKMDILDPETYPLYEGVDTVFHLAAKCCLADCLAHPVETSRINVTGTVNVLEAARRARVRKLIYADTSAEYEGIQEFPSKVEPVFPVGTYAASKRGGALFCESYRHLFDMSVTVLRYFNVYGPAQDWRRVMPPVMSAFIVRLLNSERPTIYGTGQKRRDFIYVDDVNEFHLLAMTDPRTDGRCFNIGSGSNYSVREIYDLIEEILQTGIRPQFGPNIPWEAEITLADITDSTALGWKPRIDIREGLRRSTAYIRQRVVAKVAQTTGRTQS